MIPWRRPRRTIVDLIEAALRQDPNDAPPVFLEADIFADDLARYSPTAVEPTRGGDRGLGSATLPA